MRANPNPKIELTLNASDMHDIAARRAASEAFGLDEATLTAIARSLDPVTVHATAAQFGLFVTYRCNNGGRNRIQQLDPRVIPNPLSKVIDVTQ